MSLELLLLCLFNGLVSQLKLRNFLGSQLVCSTPNSSTLLSCSLWWTLIFLSNLLILELLQEVLVISIWIGSSQLETVWSPPFYSLHTGQSLSSLCTGDWEFFSDVLIAVSAILTSTLLKRLLCFSIANYMLVLSTSCITNTQQSWTFASVLLCMVSVCPFCSLSLLSLLSFFISLRSLCFTIVINCLQCMMRD